MLHFQAIPGEYEVSLGSETEKKNNNTRASEKVQRVKALACYSSLVTWVQALNLH